jgi:hypothetical protein
VSDGRGAQLAIAGLCAAGFTIALAALVTSQLALMSVLDSDRAARAADQIASSRFTADVIAQTVDRAVAPLAGADVAASLSTTASTDPNVTAAVSDALLAAHRALVDPTALTAGDGNAAVDRAIVQSVIDAATQSGIDLQTLGADADNATLAGIPLTDVAARASLPSVVPTDVPDLGLRRLAENTRIIALLAMVALGFIAVIAHPRPGRSLRGLGWAVAVVCGTWLVGLWIAGRVIGLTSTTLFGEMIDAVWSDAVPSMLLLTSAGAIIGIALWIAGTAFDGFDVERARRSTLPVR